MWSSIGFVESTLEIREMLVNARPSLCVSGAGVPDRRGGATGLAVSQRELARLQQLCAYGQRLMELDGEDLANPDAAHGASTDTTFAILVGTEMVPLSLVARGALCYIRQQPEESSTDALYSLHPTFQLLLEVLQIRWDRHDTLWLISAAHIAGEYAPMLAWQPYLGHAGDPFRLRSDPAFADPAVFGVISTTGPAPARNRRRPRPRGRFGSPGATFRLAGLPRPAGLRCLPRARWLRDRLSAALHGHHAASGASTGSDCAKRAAPRLHTRAARSFGCAIERPSGTGSACHRGTRSPKPGTAAGTGIAKRGGLGEAALVEDGFPLPGLPSLFSAIAGSPLRPDTLVHDTMREVVTGLDPDGVVW
jgi:hypothetical protein